MCMLYFVEYLGVSKEVKRNKDDIIMYDIVEEGENRSVIHVVYRGARWAPRPAKFVLLLFPPSLL